MTYAAFVQKHNFLNIHCALYVVYHPSKVSVLYSCVCVRPDIPVKVVGILPQRNERGMLLKMVYALFERLSVYRYGRIELNLFISEKEYLVKEQAF